ncbi:hypothetical protein C8R43DRAFT_1135929 [Mycena crocata]|nr:hypothetical protein C8R43DRAFT_1135929 [Mycena crocata]
MLLDIDDDDAPFLLELIRARQRVRQRERSAATAAGSSAATAILISPGTSALTRVQEKLVSEGKRRKVSWVNTSEATSPTSVPLLGAPSRSSAMLDIPDSMNDMSSRPSPSRRQSQPSIATSTEAFVPVMETLACAFEIRSASAYIPQRDISPAAPPRCSTPLCTPPRTPHALSDVSPQPSTPARASPRIFSFPITPTPRPPRSLLSPLRFPRSFSTSSQHHSLLDADDLSGDLSPAPPSPTSTLVGSSPEKRSQGKRSAAQAELSGEITQRGKRQCSGRQTSLGDNSGGSSLEFTAAQAFSEYLSRGRQAQREEEEEDDNDEEGSDDEYADAPRRRGRRRRGAAAGGGDCPRGADRPRRRTAAAIAAGASRSMAQIQADVQREDVADEEEEGEAASAGKGKGKGKAPRWQTDGTPPEITEGASRQLIRLSLIPTTIKHQSNLILLLVNLGVPLSLSAPSPASEPHDATLDQLANRCQHMEELSVVTDFHQMVSYIELSLYINWLQNRPSPTRVTMKTLATSLCNINIDEAKLQRWFSFGSRLIYLAIAGTMFLVPLLAAAGMKNDLHKTAISTIQGTAYALCCPEADDGSYTLGVCAGRIIRTSILPQIANVKQLSSSLSTSHFRLLVPPSPTSDQPTYIPFHDLASIQEVLRCFTIRYYTLPDPVDLWSRMGGDILAVSMLKIPQLIDESCVAEEIRISTELDLKKTPCPVSKETSDEWTADQRAKALDAREATDIEDLRQQAQILHKGGSKTSEKYILVDTKICEGKVLHFRGADGIFLCFVATNIPSILTHLNESFLNQISTLLVGEVFEDLSDRIDFSFLAWHCSYYNRYAEQGPGDLGGQHPHSFRKSGKKKINHVQRVPHPSREMEEDPDEADLLSELMQLITLIAEYHVKKFLPDEYAELKIYVTKLPLNQRSAAHPFGGFVINVSAATRGHRDRFDKLFCVVIPFGNWTGGELGLYELGFVFRLHAWDMFVFPSCDITHFNLHFKGVRLSIVLHSDKAGDTWMVLKPMGL